MSRKERVKSERLQVTGKAVGVKGVLEVDLEFTSRPKCVKRMNDVQLEIHGEVLDKWSVDTLKRRLTDKGDNEFRYKGFQVRRFFAE